MAGERIVLYVDDDQDDLLFLKDALNSIDPSIQIMEATDGLEALKLLNGLKADKKTLPCLNILDLNMPRMDGKQLLSLIKEDEAFMHIPTVIFTTSSNASNDKFFEKHNTDCITKPSDIHEYVDIAYKLLSYCGV